MGLPGCTIDISRQVAQYGFGRTLFQAVATNLFAEFMEFHAKWHRDLFDVLERDPQRHLGQGYYDIARVIDEEHTEFPDPAILATYLLPLTLWSDGGQSPVTEVTSRQPDLAALSTFCLKSMGWPLESLQPRLMEARVGAVVRALLQVRISCSSHTLPSSPCRYSSCQVK